MRGCIFVGIGTTAEQFARFLPARPGLVAVTASLPIASLLGTRPVEVVALGGSVRRDELTCVGPVAVATLGRYRFDLAVVGAAGSQRALGHHRARRRRGRDPARRPSSGPSGVVVIADGSKIGGAANAVVADADRIRTLVTDPSAPGDELDGARRGSASRSSSTGAATPDETHASAPADGRRGPG